MILFSKVTNTEPNLIVLSSTSVTAVVKQLLDKSVLSFLRTVMIMTEMQKK